MGGETIKKIISVLSISLMLAGCTTTTGPEELAVLNHYRSVDSYGSLFIEKSVPSELGQIAHDAERYARARGIEVVAENQATSHIQITHGNEEERYKVTLLQKGLVADQMELKYSNISAELIIDEMLLLWHSPQSAQLKEKATPEFYLLPTFYEAKAESIGSLLTPPLPWKMDSSINVNVGYQAWYDLDSLTPTFSWQEFPRVWDLSPGTGKEDFKNIRYQFRLIERSIRLNLGELIFAEDLIKPEFEVEESLPSCTEMAWTVRATFELNGVPRQTEWSGYYNTKINYGPWLDRRGFYDGKFIGEVLPNVHVEQSYYFTVRSPQSPFGEACGY